MDLVYGGEPASLNRFTGLLSLNILVSISQKDLVWVTITSQYLLPFDTRAATTGREEFFYQFDKFTGFQ